MKRTPMQRKTPLTAKTGIKRSSMRSAGKPKASPIRKSAQGQQCQVRVPGVCNGNPETVVLAHMNGGGMGAKAHDIHGAFACSSCHAWLDGGYAQTGTFRDTRDLHHLEAIIRTQRILIEKGLIEVRGAA